MKHEDIEKMSNDDQFSYWLGRLILAIGQGDLRSELCMMVDFYQRIAYYRGVEDGKKQ